MAPILSFLALGALAFNSASAHPGHSVAQEAAERGHWLRTRQPRSVRTCANTIERRSNLNAAAVRRSNLANKLRAERGLVSRSFEQYNISHASSKDVTLGDDELELFSDNSSCVLQPEVTQGPYYVDGELMREDIREGQEGVPLYLNVQLIDTSTCSPVPAVYVDTWHCNATGVYSGVVASGNGNGEDDSTNLQNTFLRGIQQTDVNGVVQFVTIVPGHYTGRAPHIHVLTHNTNSTTIRTNHTILNSAGNFSTHASHVGQIFFDQDLLATVSETSPYDENTQTLTTNAEDSILIEETDGMDPFVEYVYVNPDNIADGILAWITLGIDPTSDQDISTVGTFYKAGAVANSNSGMGGGGSPPGGNGTMPSGAMSGAVPSGTPPAK